MILDTSALIAILKKEADAGRYVQAISEATILRISAGTFVELAMVTEGQFDNEITRQADALLRRIDIVIEPVTIDQAYIARQAFLDYGKRRHPATLNYGDCFSYALAKATGEPLLFKGNDFAKTDIISALDS